MSEDVWNMANAMKLNPYAFNSDIKYSARMVFLQKFLVGHIQVVAPDVVNRKGDFIMQL